MVVSIPEVPLFAGDGGSGILCGNSAIGWGLWKLDCGRADRLDLSPRRLAVVEANTSNRWFHIGRRGVARVQPDVTPLGAIACLALAVFGADMTIAPSWTVCIDIGQKNSGAVSGTMNMAGNLGSFVTALAFPYLLKWTGSHTTFFYVGTGLNLAAIAAWYFTKPDRKLEDY